MTARSRCIKTPHIHLLLLVIVALLVFSCSDSGNNNNVDGDDDNPVDGDSETDNEDTTSAWPACGTNATTDRHMIPGPDEEGYDADLAAKVRRYERSFHNFNGYPMAVSVDVAVPLDDTASRDEINSFVRDSDLWSFEEYSGGKTALDVVSGWQKVAGLYGGMGIVADAIRYAVLRDRGADCDEIEIARQQLLKAIDGLHIAFTIGGVPGVVARGFIKNTLPGDAQAIRDNDELVPLFDGSGNPLPEEKSNGEWREDNSGEYPDYFWEDSCSRDMMLGWAAASAVTMEVIGPDDSFPEELKTRIRSDSKKALDAMRVVREDGYDLQFPDADGRITFHGYINEHCVERAMHLETFENGFYAMMALGIVGAYAYASGDPDAQSYLYDELIAERKLPELARDSMIYINMEYQTNFSNYSMAFTSAWLAMRYIDDQAARDILREAIAVQLYDTPDMVMQPVEQKMSLYDFIYAASELDGTAFSDPDGALHEDVVARGLETLKEFSDAPYWENGIMNCDEEEINNGICTMVDDSEMVVLGTIGRKGDLICEEPVPKRIRPPSNYEWRSNPYRPNSGSDGSRLLPGVDFMSAYWIGRWTKLPQEK